MLEEDYTQWLAAQLAALECHVRLPRELREQIAKTGVIKSIHDDERRYVRMRLFAKALLIIPGQSLPALPRPYRVYSVYTRDFSIGSVCFYHTEQLYPGERHYLCIPAGKIHCTVRRCTRLKEACFEVGSTFNEVDEDPPWKERLKEMLKECARATAAC